MVNNFLSKMKWPQKLFGVKNAVFGTKNPNILPKNGVKTKIFKKKEPSFPKKKTKIKKKTEEN